MGTTINEESGVNVIRFLLIIFVTVLCYSSAVAQPTLVIENGRVIIGNGTVLEQASVLVAGDSIISVTQEPVEAPDARRIDASGKTILPGLIDAHVHLTIPPNGRDSTALVKHLEENIPTILNGFLDHGITTVRSTGDYWPWIRDLRDRVGSNKLLGPRIITSGPILTAKGGHPIPAACGNDVFCRSRAAYELTEPAEARKAVRKLSSAGVDLIKIASDSILAPVHIKDEIVQAIINQAHQEGLRATAHVPEAEFMDRYAEMDMDGFVHPPMHPLHTSDQLLQLADKLSKHGTPVTTTLYAVLAYIDKPIANASDRSSIIESQSKNIAILDRKGVPIVVGTDWCACNPGENPDFKAGAMTITELKRLRCGGMSRADIIQAATANAAQALEIEDEVGTLEEGKLADLIVVDGNPLEDLSVLEKVEVVVQGGEIVTSNSR